MTVVWSWNSMLHAWEAGGVARGNVEGALLAEAAEPRFLGGEYCPMHCSSVVRFRPGQHPQEAMNAHMDNPAACRKHPDATGRRHPVHKNRQKGSRD